MEKRKNKNEQYFPEILPISQNKQMLRKRDYHTRAFYYSN